MQEVASLVDMRFGHGTWRSIVEERARRIQAAKEAAAEARRKKIQEAREFEENLKQFFLIAGAVVAAAMFFVVMIVMMARADDVQFVTCRLAKYKKVNEEWHCYYEGANKTRTSMVISEFCPTSYMCEYDPNSSNKIVEW